LFDKVDSDSGFVQWLVNVIAQQAIAEKDGDSERATTLAGTIERVRRAVSDVTGGDVQLRARKDLGGVDVVLDGHPVPHGQLPMGLGALFTWVGDLLMRLDRLDWVEEVPVHLRSFVLLLDEVEAHLHPAWQRRVLPMAERLFPNAQIIAATHSPFVIQSASDAWVHRFALADGRSQVAERARGPFASSYSRIVHDLLEVESEFSSEVEDRWARFRALRSEVLAGRAPRSAYDAAARELAAESEELYRMVASDAHQLDRQLSTKAASG
jgi:predicted ATP-binding protein involved in virulence